VGREGELRIGPSEPVRKTQVGDVGGFPKGQGAVVRFDVGALDQADVDASGREVLEVSWRAAEVGLCRGAEPTGQAAAGDGLDAIIDQYR
jgi:hypothetical protein